MSFDATSTMLLTLHQPTLNLLCTSSPHDYHCRMISPECHHHQRETRSCTHPQKRPRTRHQSVCLTRVASSDHPISLSITSITVYHCAQGLSLQIPSRCRYLLDPGPAPNVSVQPRPNHRTYRPHQKRPTRKSQVAGVCGISKV